MLSFFDPASIAASPAYAPDARLQEILSTAVSHWQASGVLDLTHLLVVQPGDTEEAIYQEVGFSPLVSPLDGSRFGSPGFHPFWDGLREREGWFELIMTVSNSGFAFVLFIQDEEGVLPELLRLCRTYAE